MASSARPAKAAGSTAFGMVLYLAAQSMYLAAQSMSAIAMAAPARSNVVNVIAFPRPFRARPPDDRVRASGNAALLAVAILIVIGGVVLVDALAGIPRHVDCNFSKHRPCHHFAEAN